MSMSGRRRIVGAFLRNPTACLGAVILLLLVVYCVLVPLLSPYDPNDADFSVGRQSPSTGSAPTSTDGTSSPVSPRAGGPRF
jgi:hypothetical protein